ncbi:hypothetical protein HUK45_01165 [Limosilactobacillus sp. c9Ua_26_M]|uniref:Uncharacterized protein n=1 Tax=Limosilactobacillus urinaemulieris TaxID=2742600 RepID=A0ABR8ZHW9_9LACO|nr:hypothetical protein [Limosilactobacillus urinaemulieris]MBD8084885.1 hypothetical protein [Limosilactobacillus urinaemulieris]
MKKFGRPVGIILATAYLGMVLGLEYVRVLDWKSLLILFAMFVVWALIVFANIATFFENRTFKFLGFEIGAKETVVSPSNNKSNSLNDLKIEINNLKEANKKINDKIEEVNKRITKSHPPVPKMNFDEMLGTILFVSGIGTGNTDYNDMEADGSTFNDFCEQIALAKGHNVEIEKSVNYKKMLNIYLNAIESHLMAQLVLMYDRKANSFEDTIQGTFKQYPYSKETLLAVRDDFIDSYGKKSQCTLLFDEIINKLDKMY